MTNEEIKELLDIFNASGVGELELQRGEDRIRIRKGGVEPEPAAAAPTPAALTGAPAPEPEIQADQTLVKSPIVGTFYESASPGAAPFVKVGDTVEPGQ